MLADSHAHLDNKDFSPDRKEVIERSGLDYILNVAIDPASAKLSLELADLYSNIYVSIGIHPHYTKDVDLFLIRDYLTHPKVKAIGEIGLDFYRDVSPREIQEDVFRKCLDEAAKLEFPAVIHQRNAQDEIIAILRKYNVSGVMHCFSGSIEFAKKCVDLGFFISFAGNITYPKADELRKIAEFVPLDRLLIETDCPWLAPQKFRGKRNEPSYLKYIAQSVAEIRKMDIDNLGNVVTENFRKLFKIS